MKDKEGGKVCPAVVSHHILTSQRSVWHQSLSCKMVLGTVSLFPRKQILLILYSLFLCTVQKIWVVRSVLTPYNC